MKLLLQIQKWILFLSCIFIVLGLSLTVFLRYILEMDLFGIEEIIIIPMFLLYFIGASLGSYENSHITADVLDSFVKNPKVLLWIRTFTNLVSFIACAVFSYWAIQYFSWSFNKMESTSGWNIPLFIPHGIVMVGFILMGFYTLVHIINQIQLIRGKKVEGQ